MKSSPFVPILGLLLATAAAIGISHSPSIHNGMGFYPEILTFAAAPDGTLSWETRGAVAVTLEATAGTPESTQLRTNLPANGFLKVTPGETTTYRLRCQTVFSGQACAPTELTVDSIKAPMRQIESGI